jgi:ERF superfamily
MGTVGGGSMTETAKLNAALAALQGELPSVRKDKTAKVKSERTGSEYTYPYADLADIAEAIHPLMSKHGLAFAAAPHFREDGKYVLVGELLHVSGESKAGEFPLPIGKPQEIGSAYTYGRRYLLCGLTGVVADQDDDGAAAQKAAASKAKPPQRRRVPSSTTEPDPREPLWHDIKEAREAKGWSSADVAQDFAAGHDGKKLMDATFDELQAYADTLREPS